MCMGILSACMSVQRMCIWCLQRPENEAGSHGTKLGDARRMLRIEARFSEEQPVLWTN